MFTVNLYQVLYMDYLSSLHSPMKYVYIIIHKYFQGNLKPAVLNLLAPSPRWFKWQSLDLKCSSMTLKPELVLTVLYCLFTEWSLRLGLYGCTSEG